MNAVFDYTVCAKRPCRNSFSQFFHKKSPREDQFRFFYRVLKIFDFSRKIPSQIILGSMERTGYVNLPALAATLKFVYRKSYRSLKRRFLKIFDSSKSLRKFLYFWENSKFSKSFTNILLEKQVRFGWSPILNILNYVFQPAPVQQTRTSKSNRYHQLQLGSLARKA